MDLCNTDTEFFISIIIAITVTKNICIDIIYEHDKQSGTLPFSIALWQPQESCHIR